MLMNKPYQCQLEFVRGCNMKCDFCGNHSLPKEKKFMTDDTLFKILTGMLAFGLKTRVQIAMRGEPTLHPEWKRFTEYIRLILSDSQITLTTNGLKLQKEDLVDFYSAGGNIVMVDCYEQSMDKFVKRFESLKVKKFIFPDDQFSPWNYHSKSIRCILFTRDLRQYSALQRQFTNQCGAIKDSAYKKYNIKRIEEPLKKSCTNPFREVAFHYNGDAPLCCKDWLGNRIIYNVHKNKRSLREVWEHDPILNKVRALLYNKNREFSPCSLCNYDGGFYKGFLPKLKQLSAEDIERYKEEVE